MLSFRFCLSLVAFVSPNTFCILESNLYVAQEQPHGLKMRQIDQCFWGRLCLQSTVLVQVRSLCEVVSVFGGSDFSSRLFEHSRRLELSDREPLPLQVRLCLGLWWPWGLQHSESPAQQLEEGVSSRQAGLRRCSRGNLVKAHHKPTQKEHGRDCPKLKYRRAGGCAGHRGWSFRLAVEGFTQGGPF